MLTPRGDNLYRLITSEFSRAFFFTPYTPFAIYFFFFLHPSSFTLYYPSIYIKSSYWPEYRPVFHFPVRGSLCFFFRLSALYIRHSLRVRLIQSDESEPSRASRANWVVHNFINNEEKTTTTTPGRDSAEFAKSAAAVHRLAE